MRSTPFVLIPIVALVALAANAAPPITNLTADVDCTGSEQACVALSNGTLMMNGFTITGGTVGVLCTGSCRITGPGTIREAEMGISAYGKLTVSQVDVDASEYIGIQCFKSCSVTGGTLSNSGDPQNPEIAGGEGIRSTGVLKLDGVTITNNGYGALARSYPRHHGRLIARNSVFSGNGIGAIADKSAKLTDSTATGNLVAGVLIGDFLYEDPCPDAPRTVALKNTAVTGNGTGDGCGTTRSCADLMTCRSPKLDALSSCGTSYVNGSGLPGSDWDVCAAD